MSQIIRKLQNGDKAPEVKQQRLFRDGNRDIDLDVLIKGANKNITQYLDSKNWNRKKKQAFMDAYSDIMTSLDNGTISQRDVGRSYVDSSGRIQNSKGRGFDAYGEAAAFLNTIVDIVPDYQKEKPKEKTKYNSDELMLSFRNKFFGGNDPDAIVWQGRDTKDETTGKYGTTRRAEDFAQLLDDYAASLADSDYDYEGSAYKGKDDLLARLQAASAQLRDGTFDNNDYSALTALGISGETARTLFSTDALQEEGSGEEKKPDDPELTEAQEGLARAQEQAERQEIIDQYKQLQRMQQLSQELTQKWYEPAKNFQRQVIALPKVTLNKEAWENLLEKTDKASYYNRFQNLFTTYDPYTHQNMRVYNHLLNKDGTRQSVPYLQHIANNLSYLDQIGALKESGIEGFKYYPGTVDEKTGTVVLYNPTTNTYMREAVYNVPVLVDELLNQGQNQNPFAMKNGGVLEFQLGGTVDYNTLITNSINNSRAQKREEEEARVKKKASDSGRDVETQQKRDTKLSDKGLDGVDIARISSAVLDLGSIGASFIPVAGTVASGVTGLASTFTNFGADWAEDGLDSQDWKNFATNLGLDLVGLLPGVGAAGKAGKIAKTLGKTLPKVIGILSTMSIVQQSPQILGSFQKLTTGNFKDITTEDLQNIGTGLAAIAAGSRSINSARQIKAYKKAAATGKNNIKLEDGRVVAITDDQLKEIKKAKNLEEANKAIQKATGDETATLSSTFRGSNPFKAKFYSLKGNPTTGQEFDFNFTDNNGRKFGEHGRGGRSLDEWWFKTKTWQNGPVAPSWWNNWISQLNGRFGDRFKYNIYGRQSSKPQSSQSTTTKIVEQLPTSRRIRLREKGISDEELNRRGIYKDGGILFAKNGVRNVLSNDVSWVKDIYNSKGFWDTLNMITPENLEQYNKMQNQYATLGFTDQKPGDNLVFNQGVADYQTLFQNQTQINNQTMADLVKRGVITGRGNSSDKGVEWTADGLAGTQTWLRHLGTVLGTDQQMLAKMNENLNQRGIEAFYNEETGMVNYRLKPQEPAQAPAPAQTPEQAQPTPRQDAPAGNEETRFNGTPQNSGNSRGTWLGVFLDQAPDFLAAGRLAGNIMNNNRVAREVKQGLKPFIEDTYNLQRRVAGDLATRQRYHSRAAGLESLASRPMTSDASLQLAGQLDARVKGDEYRAAGDAYDNQAIKESQEQAWKVQADNAARRSEVANRNRARILQNNAALHQLEAGRMSSNWTSVDNFLKEREYSWRTKRNQQRQFNLGVARDYLTNKYSETPEMEGLRKQILEKQSKGEDYTDLMNKYTTLREQQSIKFNNEYNDVYARIYGLYYRRPIYTPTPTLKKGGTVEAAKIRAHTESAKLFQNNIKESVKNNIKMIDNLSRVTKELILKSMTL